MRVVKVPITWRWEVYCRCNHRMVPHKDKHYHCTNPKCKETVRYDTVEYLKGGGMG